VTDFGTAGRSDYKKIAAPVAGNDKNAAPTILAVEDEVTKPHPT
jgi:hypothetical protein